jgi:peptidoglycan/LPS O-acetylase OafA/YrhL
MVESAKRASGAYRAVPAGHGNHRLAPFVVLAARHVPPFRLGHRPVLDGIRGLAMLLVLVFHLGVLVWPAAREWLLQNGYVGVDLFFVLSGFLITSLLLGEHDHHGRVDVRSFLWRRVVRLVPALLVVLALALVAAVLGYGPHTPGELLLIDATTLAFVNNWFAPEHVTREMGQTWSVAVEGQFYLVWSLTVAAVTAGLRVPVAARTGAAGPGPWVRRRPRELLVTVAVLGIALVALTRWLRYGAGENPFVLYLQTTARLDGPLVGTIAGVAYASGWLDRVPRRLAAVAAVVGLVGLGAAAVVVDPYDDFLYKGGFPVVALLGALIVTGAVLLPAGRLTAALSARPLVLAGTISYSVFLWHVPVFVVLARDVDGLPVGLQVAAGLGGTFLLGGLSYRFVERPLMHRVRRAQDSSPLTVVVSPLPLAEPALAAEPEVLPPPTPATETSTSAG